MDWAYLLMVRDRIEGAVDSPSRGVQFRITDALTVVCAVSYLEQSLDNPIISTAPPPLTYPPPPLFYHFRTLA